MRIRRSNSPIAFFMPRLSEVLAVREREREVGREREKGKQRVF